MFPIRLSPQTFENTAIYSVFLSFLMFQCCWPTQTYVQEILPKHGFSQCFYNVSHQKHGNSHVFGNEVGPKHWFLQCFQCSDLQKLVRASLFIRFFHFSPISPLPEAYQNDSKFHVNTLLSSDTQKSPKNHENTT